MVKKKHNYWPTSRKVIILPLQDRERGAIPRSATRIYEENIRAYLGTDGTAEEDAY